MQSAMVTSQAQGAGQAGQQAVERNASTHGTTGGHSAAQHADDGSSLTSHADDPEVLEALRPLEHPETGEASAGAGFADVFVHRQASEARVAAGQPNQPLPGRPGRTPPGAAVNPNPGYQSAHLCSQAALRDLPHYNPNEMLTRLLPTGQGHQHTLFDQHWQRQFSQIHAQTGRGHTTAGELYEVTTNALKNSGAFPPEQAESLRLMLSDELFGRLGLSAGTPLRMPGI
jgi:hypothetical protein